MSIYFRPSDRHMSKAADMLGLDRSEIVTAWCDRVVLTDAPRAFGYMLCITDTAGREKAFTIKQARNKHGRRYDWYADPCDAKNALYAWAQRIEREARKEQED